MLRDKCSIHREADHLGSDLFLYPGKRPLNTILSVTLYHCFSRTGRRRKAYLRQELLYSLRRELEVRVDNLFESAKETLRSQLPTNKSLELELEDSGAEGQEYAYAVLKPEEKEEDALSP